MTSPRWASARYGAAGMAAGLILAWALGAGRLPTAAAAGASPAPGVAEAGGTMAFTSAGVGPQAAQYLYLIDTRSQSLAVYSINPQKTDGGSLKLEAARHYQWDLRLNEYNNAPPTVSAIESTVGAVKR